MKPLSVWMKRISKLHRRIFTFLTSQVVTPGKSTPTPTHFDYNYHGGGWWSKQRSCGTYQASIREEGGTVNNVGTDRENLGM
jgi:hypothetical protein